MLNPYSKFDVFMFRSFKDIHFYISLLLSNIQMLTSLAQAVMSQAETRELSKRVFIVIMSHYLFEFNGSRMNLVKLIQKIFSINDILRFWNSTRE